MKVRKTLSINEEVLQAAEVKAKQDNRSLSSFIEVLLLKAVKPNKQKVHSL